MTLSHSFGATSAISFRVLVPPEMGICEQAAEDTGYYPDSNVK